MPHITSTVFKLYSDGAKDMEDWCTVEAFRPHTRTSCGFNSSHPLIIITHGWSVRPVLSSPPGSTSDDTLGAHISGFAGSYLGGPGKIGRITGLDPAGPLFEGMAASDRLSPDDALFVDAIHTYTQERMGLSVGIKQPVAHVDFYHNGGDFQPGCHPFQSLMEHIALHGINGFEQTVKCAHERSVYLFIDSLLNKDKQIMACRCSDDNAFEKGTCLDYRKNKCNTLSYNVRRVRSVADKKLYNKTHSSMYVGNTVECQKSFLNKQENVIEEISGNKTYTFLITLDSDIGDLMMLMFRWEGSTFNPWGSGGMRPKLTVGKIRVKAGETQNRWVSIPLGGASNLRTLRGFEKSGPGARLGVFCTG
uniref:Lipase, hepatic a n=1 Tax=Salmo trutta TaxID=8032 RepID=A0A674EWZ8_SALTR